MDQKSKSEADFTLEDWVAYHASRCGCSGHFKCAGCTLNDLDASWRKTLQVERDSFAALNVRYSNLRSAHDALKRDAAQRP